MRPRVLPWLVVMCWLFEAGAFAAEATMGPSDYAGSDRCAECHREVYEQWRQTFHATVVQDAKKDPSVILGDFSVEDLGFTRDDVEFTIGGHWDQRYMKKIGDDYYVLPKLWSVQSQTWRPYNVWSWKKRPYSKYCKGCHVTAYDPQANVTVAENRVGCEACHGPGWAHAESGGERGIVHPEKLPEDRQSMICAACHVRGQDPSGEYYFPVGFVPGEDLGRYYVPGDKQQEESNGAAILRNFESWKEKRRTGAQGKCEVCGIPGTTQERAKEDGTLDFCFGCHEFKDRYPEHTHHPKESGVECYDCHVLQKRDLAYSGDEPDVHTPEYFLLHANACYDRALEKACVKCHESEGEEWARKAVERWRSPVEVDH